MRRLTLTLALGIALALALGACGAPAAPPLPPGASAQPADQNTMADALAGSFAMHIGRQPGDGAVRLYRVPDDTRWPAVRQFYAERLGADGWREDPALLVEGDTFSYAGWARGGDRVTVGLVENTIGDGAYLAVAAYR